MCRLAAFPPGFSRNEAIDVLEEMEGWNKDGVGYAYVRPDGKFVTARYPGSLQSLLAHTKKSEAFLAHMPYQGWTIVHLRMATHGGVAEENTHPFVAGPWCVVHNGIWSGHTEARLALGKSVKFWGKTDSEVAAHMIRVVGPKKFAKAMEGGVFLCLNRNGKLWALKTGGELKHLVENNVTLIASSLAYGLPGVKSFPLGWFQFSAKGLCDKYEIIEPKTIYYHPPARDTTASDAAATKRFGATVVEHKAQGSPKPYGPTDQELHDGATGWYMDNDHNWHRCDPGPGDDEPAQSEIINPAIKWYYDQDTGQWVEKLRHIPHCTGKVSASRYWDLERAGSEDRNRRHWSQMRGKIEVPRDEDVEDSRYTNLPRYPALPVANPNQA